MGRSYTPAYRVEITANVPMSNMAYSVKHFGKASAEGLEAFVRSLNESFAPGGVNFFEGDEEQAVVKEAALVHQASGKVVAEYVTPLFEVILFEVI